MCAELFITSLWCGVKLVNFVFIQPGLYTDFKINVVKCEDDLITRCFTQTDLLIIMWKY